MGKEKFSTRILVAIKWAGLLAGPRWTPIPSLEVEPQRQLADPVAGAAIVGESLL
jgi:hypothetical protein